MTKRRRYRELNRRAKFVASDVQNLWARRFAHGIQGMVDGVQAFAVALPGIVSGLTDNIRKMCSTAFCFSVIASIHDKDLFDTWAKPLRAAALRRDGLPFLMFADDAEERGYTELALEARTVGERMGA